MLPAGIRRVCPDVFVMALTGTVAIATMLPCEGASARFFHAAAIGAIAALFFLQGARLSREAILAGMTNWKLHATIAGTTFVLFPLMGSVLVELMPHVLDRTLVLGVLFLCALPSTVQSSIALTSIAQGNVAGAVCAATASSLIGLVLTPLLFGFMSHVRGGGVDISGMWQVFAELLLPFAAGHLLRPWIGPWAARNKSLLAITDRGSILLVVYTAFSAAVVHGIWHQLPPAMLGALAIVVAALLAAGLFITSTGARVCGFTHPTRSRRFFADRRSRWSPAFQSPACCSPGRRSVSWCCRSCCITRCSSSCAPGWHVAMRTAPTAAAVGAGPALPVGAAARQEIAA